MTRTRVIQVRLWLEYPGSDNEPEPDLIYHHEDMNSRDHRMTFHHTQELIRVFWSVGEGPASTSGAVMWRHLDYYRVEWDVALWSDARAMWLDHGTGRRVTR